MDEMGVDEEMSVKRMSFHFIRTSPIFLFMFIFEMNLSASACDLLASSPFW
jgi:hypothetical protein